MLTGAEQVLKLGANPRLVSDVGDLLIRPARHRGPRRAAPEQWEHGTSPYPFKLEGERCVEADDGEDDPDPPSGGQPWLGVVQLGDPGDGEPDRTRGHDKRGNRLAPGTARRDTARWGGVIVEVEELFVRWA